MSNFETVQAITENIGSLLDKQGVHFTVKSLNEIKTIPGSMLPVGTISYSGESFEETLGERPGYIEAEFALTVLINERDSKRALLEKQRWTHRVREALAPASLNTGKLASSMLISRVRVPRVDAVEQEGFHTLSFKVFIKYRES